MMMLSKESYKILQTLAEPLKHKMWDDNFTESEWHTIKLLNTLDLALSAVEEMLEYSIITADDLSKTKLLINAEIAEVFNRREAK